MTTTSGADAPARQVFEARSSGVPGGARQRLITLVRSIEAYVAGRDSIPERPTPFPVAAAPASAASSPSGREGVARAARRGAPRADSPSPTVAPPTVLPLGPDRPPSPQRPRPLDKPLAVAHYEMLARQVAYERQVSDLAAGPIATAPRPASRGVLPRG